MASMKASRFAVLKIDDDIDDEAQSSKNKQNTTQKNQQQSANKKKKNKKKKSEQAKAEADQLRNLAFGTSGGKKHTTSTSSHGAGDHVTEEQWDEWRRVDEGYAQADYEQSLQQALLLSKLDLEEKKTVMQASGDGQNGATESKKKNKKKNKEKPAKMSLEQFNQLETLPQTKPAGSDDSDEDVSTPMPEPCTEVSNPDPTFFMNVDKDVGKILQKEKIQEHYKQQYAMESALSVQYQEEISSRDKTIEQLKKNNKDVKSELKQAKERNQQLCHILSQGEMKNKTKLLQELEELRRINGELTAEVSSLTEGLEKERSKVHQLTAEHAKPKGGKHAGK